MYEIRVHGRGGQGAVTAAELVAAAAFENGAEGVQAFPSFGVERMPKKSNNNETRNGKRLPHGTL